MWTGTRFACNNEFRRVLSIFVSLVLFVFAVLAYLLSSICRQTRSLSAARPTAVCSAQMLQSACLIDYAIIFLFSVWFSNFEYNFGSFGDKIAEGKSDGSSAVTGGWRLRFSLFLLYFNLNCIDGRGQLKFSHYKQTAKKIEENKCSTKTPKKKWTEINWWKWSESFNQINC